MAKIYDMMQKRAKLTTSIRALMDRYDGAEMSAEDKAELSRMEASFDAVNARIIDEQKQLERERMAGEIADDVDRQTGNDSEIENAFRAHLRMGSGETLVAYNALQQDNPSQAGYLVAPEKFVNTLIAELDNALPFRSMCKRMTLTGAQSMGFPKRIERMNSAAWGTEISAPTPDASLAFGRREFKPMPATAEILLSRTLIRNAPEVEGIVIAEMAYDFGELLENAYMTGDGAGKPLGLFTPSADGISTARDVSTASLSFDALMDAKYSIRAPYQPRLRWLFHRSAVGALAKVKDSNGQYIWQPSTVENAPDRILGRPVVMSEYAPYGTGSGDYMGILGDFGNYWIVDGMQLTMQVLTELYARTNQIDYIGRLETDGMPVLEECFARIRKS